MSIPIGVAWHHINWDTKTDHPNCLSSPTPHWYRTFRDHCLDKLEGSHSYADSFSLSSLGQALEKLTGEGMTRPVDHTTNMPILKPSRQALDLCDQYPPWLYYINIQYHSNPFYIQF